MEQRFTKLSSLVLEGKLLLDQVHVLFDDVGELLVVSIDGVLVDYSGLLVLHVVQEGSEHLLDVLVVRIEVLFHGLDVIRHLLALLFGGFEPGIYLLDD